MSIDPALHAQSDEEILALSPEHLVPLLYARVLHHLRGALIAIHEEEVAARSYHLERALTIILELMATLDLERGGEVAPRLIALYSYFASEIVTLGRSLDTELLRRIIEMIGGLHASWEQAAHLATLGSEVACAASGDHSSFS
jgi:flagellar secretion chaperone FliS